MNVDGAPDIPVEAGVEQTRGVLQRSSFGKRQLDHVLVRLSGAHDAAVGEDRCSWARRFCPLPLFHDLRVCLVNDCAHLRERLRAPVAKFLDPLVDSCRSRLHWLRFLHVYLLTPFAMSPE